MFVCSRVIRQAPKLKLAVEALITSLKPIGNILIISCAFFFFFGILGVQVNLVCTHINKGFFSHTDKS